MIENKVKFPPHYLILASLLEVHVTTRTALLEGEHHGGVGGHDILREDTLVGHLT